MGRIIREHWEIEALHRQLDVTFEEDACRAQNAVVQLNLNILRKPAIALHRSMLAKRKKAGEKKAQHESLRQRMKRGDERAEYVEALLSQSPTSEEEAAQKMKHKMAGGTSVC